MVGVFGTVVAQEASAGETIERGAAEDFMNDLYDTVVEDPRYVWDNLISDDLRDRHDDGFEEFRINWAQWRDVERHRVEQKPNAQNWFVIDVAYVDQDGDRQSYRPVEFHLVCDDDVANRLIVFKCKQDDLLLHDSYNTSEQR